MSNDTKGIIKSVFITALGMASIYVYSELVTDFVCERIESYFD